MIVGIIEAMEKKGREASGKWTAFALVAVGVFMGTLDSSIVNISLPAIAANFHVPLSGAIEWVVISYLVVVAASLLTAGMLADLLGRKVLWVSGLGIFTLGSALCGAAPSLPLLILFRAVQGLGAALLMAVGTALITTAFPPSERGRALGLKVLIVATGITVGPTLGGIITERLTWRWIFYVNVPTGVLGIACAAWFLTEDAQRTRERFDPVGAILLGLGLAGLTGGLSFGEELGWASPTVLGMLILSTLVLAAMLPHQLRHPAPTIDLHLFKNRVFASSGASLVLSFLALFASQAAIAVRNSQLFEHAKTLDRLKSEFVAVVSHEVS